LVDAQGKSAITRSVPEVAISLNSARFILIRFAVRNMGTQETTSVRGDAAGRPPVIFPWRRTKIPYDLIWVRGRWAIEDVGSVIEPNP
jgi:hypothetical protein